MTIEYNSLVPLLAALVGGIFSLAGTWGAVFFSRRAESKLAAHQLANAFKGEMSALIHITELRNYAGELKAMAHWCVENNSIGSFGVSSREEYRAVYKANAGNLGKLAGKLPEQIAIAYTQMASLQEDLKTLDEIHLGSRSNAWMGQPADAALRYSQMAAIIEDTIKKAKAAVTEIDRLYPA